MPRIAMIDYSISGGPTLLGPYTLLDSQVAPAVLATFPVVADKYLQLEYSLTRNNETQTGDILLTTDGTVASITDNSIDTIDLGVMFSADVSGGNLRLLYTTTVTGFNASIKYSVTNLT